MLKIEVSEFELSLLLGLVLEQRMKYEDLDLAKAIPFNADYASLARSFEILHKKIHLAKPVPV